MLLPAPYFQDESCTMRQMPERPRATYSLIDPRARNDLRLWSLSGREFREKFIAALAGEENEFSKYIRGPFVDSGRPAAAEWAQLRRAVFERDDYTCRYCGQRGVRLECDHVIPVSRGGEHGMENLATACRTCNRSKRDKTLEEWMQ